MKTEYLNTIFTKHAINRLYNRRITQSDAWYVFQHPDGSFPGKTPGSRKFYKDYGPQRIEIVAKRNEKGQWIILTCWSKQMGDGKAMFPYKKTLPEKIIKKGLSKIGKLFQKRNP